MLQKLGALHMSKTMTPSMPLAFFSELQLLLLHSLEGAQLEMDWGRNCEDAFRGLAAQDYNSQHALRILLEFWELPLHTLEDTQMVAFASSRPFS